MASAVQLTMAHGVDGQVMAEAGEMLHGTVKDVRVDLVLFRVNLDTADRAL